MISASSNFTAAFGHSSAWGVDSNGALNKDGSVDYSYSIGGGIRGYTSGITEQFDNIDAKMAYFGRDIWWYRGLDKAVNWAVDPENPSNKDKDTKMTDEDAKENAIANYLIGSDDLFFSSSSGVINSFNLALARGAIDHTIGATETFLSNINIRSFNRSNYQKIASEWLGLAYRPIAREYGWNLNGKETSFLLIGQMIAGTGVLVFDTLSLGGAKGNSFVVDDRNANVFTVGSDKDWTKEEMAKYGFKAKDTKVELGTEDKKKPTNFVEISSSPLEDYSFFDVLSNTFNEKDSITLSGVDEVRGKLAGSDKQLKFGAPEAVYGFGSQAPLGAKVIRRVGFEGEGRITLTQNPEGTYDYTPMKYLGGGIFTKAQAEAAGLDWKQIVDTLIASGLAEKINQDEVRLISKFGANTLAGIFGKDIAAILSPILQQLTSGAYETVSLGWNWGKRSYSYLNPDYVEPEPDFKGTPLAKFVDVKDEKVREAYYIGEQGTMTIAPDGPVQGTLRSKAVTYIFKQQEKGAKEAKDAPGERETTLNLTATPEVVDVAKFQVLAQKIKGDLEQLLNDPKYKDVTSLLQNKEAFDALVLAIAKGASLEEIKKNFADKGYSATAIEGLFNVVNNNKSALFGKTWQEASEKINGLKLGDFTADKLILKLAGTEYFKSDASASAEILDNVLKSFGLTSEQQQAVKAILGDTINAGGVAYAGIPAGEKAAPIDPRMAAITDSLVKSLVLGVLKEEGLAKNAKDIVEWAYNFTPGGRKNFIFDITFLNSSKVDAKTGQLIRATVGEGEDKKFSYTDVLLAWRGHTDKFGTTYATLGVASEPKKNPLSISDKTSAIGEGKLVGGGDFIALMKYMENPIAGKPADLPDIIKEYIKKGSITLEQGMMLASAFPNLANTTNPAGEQTTPFNGFGARLLQLAKGEFTPEKDALGVMSTAVLLNDNNGKVLLEGKEEGTRGIVGYKVGANTPTGYLEAANYSALMTSGKVFFSQGALGFKDAIAFGEAPDVFGRSKGGAASSLPGSVVVGKYINLGIGGYNVYGAVAGGFVLTSSKGVLFVDPMALRIDNFAARTPDVLVAEKGTPVEHAQNRGWMMDNMIIKSIRGVDGKVVGEKYFELNGEGTMSYKGTFAAASFLGEDLKADILKELGKDSYFKGKEKDGKAITLAQQIFAKGFADVVVTIKKFTDNPVMKTDGTAELTDDVILIQTTADATELTEALKSKDGTVKTHERRLVFDAKNSKVKVALGAQGLNFTFDIAALDQYSPLKLGPGENATVAEGKLSKAQSKAIYVLTQAPQLYPPEGGSKDPNKKRMEVPKLSSFLNVLNNVVKLGERSLVMGNINGSTFQVHKKGTGGDAPTFTTGDENETNRFSFTLGYGKNWGTDGQLGLMLPNFENLYITEDRAKDWAEKIGKVSGGVNLLLREGKIELIDGELVIKTKLTKQEYQELQTNIANFIDATGGLKVLEQGGFQRHLLYGAQAWVGNQTTIIDDSEIADIIKTSELKEFTIAGKKVTKDAPLTLVTIGFSKNDQIDGVLFRGTKGHENTNYREASAVLWATNGAISTREETFEVFNKETGKKENRTGRIIADTNGSKIGFAGALVAGNALSADWKAGDAFSTILILGKEKSGNLKTALIEWPNGWIQDLTPFAIGEEPPATPLTPEQQKKAAAEKKQQEEIRAKFAKVDAGGKLLKRDGQQYLAPTTEAQTYTVQKVGEKPEKVTLGPRKAAAYTLFSPFIESATVSPWVADTGLYIVGETINKNNQIATPFYTSITMKDKDGNVTTSTVNIKGSMYNKKFEGKDSKHSLAIFERGFRKIKGEDGTEISVPFLSLHNPDVLLQDIAKVIINGQQIKIAASDFDLKGIIAADQAALDQLGKGVTVEDINSGKKKLHDRIGAYLTYLSDNKPDDPLLKKLSTKVSEDVSANTSYEPSGEDVEDYLHGGKP